MGKNYFLFLVLFILIAGCANKINNIQNLNPQENEVSNMKITSPAFSHNESIPSEFTCDGANKPIPLSISGVPKNAKELALIVDDPDAVRGTFTHWVMWNISPNTTQITDGKSQGAKLGNNGAGRPGYIGPCPPSGTHRYFFKLYALDVNLNLPDSASKEDLEKAIQNHIMEKAELIGLYRRKINQ